MVTNGILAMGLKTVSPDTSLAAGLECETANMTANASTSIVASGNARRRQRR